MQGLINYRLIKDKANIFGTLGEATKLLNEQPRVQARATLSFGQSESEFDVNVNAVARPVFSADISSNNYGSKSTGTAQAQGFVSLNSPSGHLDAATMTVNVNEGSSYFRGDYSASVNDSGIRLGINASAMDYDIVEEDVQGLVLHVGHGPRQGRFGGRQGLVCQLIQDQHRARHNLCHGPGDTA